MQIKRLLSRFLMGSQRRDKRLNIFAGSREMEPVPGNWHELFVEHIASVIRPVLYVELGLYHCETFNHVIPYAQRLIGIDREASAEKWMARSAKAQFVNSTTDEFVAILKTNPILIDMLFIDADHSKAAILKDFWSFFPFISPHGLIILHDTHPKNIDFIQPGYCSDAFKAIEELSKHKDKLEMMTIPIHPGLTLCRKRTTQLSWMESNG